MPSASGTQRGAPARSRPAAGPDPAASTDPVLDAERAHLQSARKFLRLMRENVLSLRALGGDPVSEEYLKADLYRRAEALHDLPDTPLFFGRLDYSARAPWPPGPASPAGQPPAGPRLPTRTSAAPCPASSSTSAAAMCTTPMATPS